MKRKIARKVLCGMMAMCMTASLAACGSSETATVTEESKTPETPLEEATVSEQAAETTETTTETTAVASESTDLKEKYASLAGTTLRIGTGCAQAGWTMDDGSGNPEGMDVDVMNYICDYYGINIEWTVSEYASLWGMLQNDVIDTIANLTTVNDDRLGLYWFTNTYAWESYSIVSRTEDGIPEDGDMTFWDGKTVAGEAGSNATLVLEDIIAEQAEQGVTINELVLDSASVLIPAVVQKQADAEFQCTSTCAYAVAQSGNGDILHIQDVQWKNMPIVYGWARKESNKEYIKAFNELIAQMHEDGTLEELSMKWFDMDVTGLPEGEVNYVTTTGEDAWQSYEEE